MLRILIDGYFIDRPYGFGRYVRELVFALDRYPTDIEPVLLTPKRGEAVASEICSRIRIVIRKERLFPLWEQVVVPLVARKMGCQLVHFPYQSSALLWSSKNSIATIHDLMFMNASPPNTSLKGRLAHWYSRILFRCHTSQAGELVAVSNATRNDLRNRAHVDATVVENLCEAFVESARGTAPASDEGRFFLHRGHVGQHKNTRRVIEAFSWVRKDSPDVRLLVYGVGPGNGLLDGLPCQGVALLGKIDDQRLASLYRASVAVVTPSLEEGFGLSILEALAFETVVITSNIPPMCDIASNAALLVDPTQTDAIAEAMRTVLAAPECRTSLLKAGALRYQCFSAQQVAARLTDVYHRLASRLG